MVSCILVKPALSFKISPLEYVTSAFNIVLRRPFLQWNSIIRTNHLSPFDSAGNLVSSTVLISFSYTIWNLSLSHIHIHLSNLIIEKLEYTRQNFVEQSIIPPSTHSLIISAPPLLHTPPGPLPAKKCNSTRLTINARTSHMQRC